MASFNVGAWDKPNGPDLVFPGGDTSKLWPTFLGSNRKRCISPIDSVDTSMWIGGTSSQQVTISSALQPSSMGSDITVFDKNGYKWSKNTKGAKTSNMLKAANDYGAYCMISWNSIARDWWWQTNAYTLATAITAYYSGIPLKSYLSTGIIMSNTILFRCSNSNADLSGGFCGLVANTPDLTNFAISKCMNSSQGKSWEAPYIEPETWSRVYKLGSNIYAVHSNAKFTPSVLQAMINEEISMACGNGFCTRTAGTYTLLSMCMGVRPA